MVNATVRAVDGDVLVLTIGSEPLARRLSEQRNTDVIADALHAVLGGRWRGRCDPGDAAPPPARPAAIRSSTPPQRPSRPAPSRPAPPRRPAPDDGEPLPPEPPDEEAPPDDEEAMMAEAAADAAARPSAATLRRSRSSAERPARRDRHRAADPSCAISGCHTRGDHDPRNRRIPSAIAAA
jgi:DNA polymerase-3 subunit gamma/tau